MTIKHALTCKLFEPSDAKLVSLLLERNFKEVNSKDYSVAEIEKNCARYTLAYLIKSAKETNFYVFYQADLLIGCGAIARYQGKADESILLRIFVNPDYHHQKIGQTIVAVLEEDELFRLAKRVEVPSSITAVNFYRKQGYEYKDGIKKLDAEKLYRLEKFPNNS